MLRKVYDETLSNGRGPLKTARRDHFDSVRFSLGGPEADPLRLVEIRIIGFDIIA
jgi:hypothetical protein